MVKTVTETTASTYTKSRINVIEDHFELFLRCANLKDEEIKKILISVEKHELKAVGIYILEDNARVAEVEFEVDWKEHMEIVNVSGDMFDTDLPGWKDGTAPEAYVAVSRMVKYAKEENLGISSWIRVSDFIHQYPEEHKRVCRELGYNYGGSVEEWKFKPKEKTRKIEGLAEAKITSRQI